MRSVRAPVLRWPTNRSPGPVHVCLQAVQDLERMKAPSLSTKWRDVIIDVRVSIRGLRFCIFDVVGYAVRAFTGDSCIGCTLIG